MRRVKVTALDSWHWVQVEVSLENLAATWDDSGPGLQEGHEVEGNDVNCEQLVQQESWQDKDKRHQEFSLMGLGLHIHAETPEWDRRSTVAQSPGQVQAEGPGAQYVIPEVNNLTSQDSGQYWAQARFQTGREIKQVFHLTVYDPVPLAQIRTTSASITPSWCNVTLDCGAREALEVLNVTWEVQGPPSELEQRGAPGPPNPWTLALSLPLRQPNVSLTCVLSNPVDQKNATLQLLDLCSPAGHSRGAIGAFLAGFFILGVGGFLFLWHLREKKKKKKKEEMEMERGRLHLPFWVQMSPLSPWILDFLPPAF
ncbi:uncharacterized protein LOC144368196 [Ictidomys tridecemlineatus]